MTLPTIPVADLPRMAYGHDKNHDPAVTQPQKFRAVITSPHGNKPLAGGLWTAPVTKTGDDGEILATAWTDWCASEDWGLDRYTHFLEIVPAPAARVLRVDSLDDLRAIRADYGLTPDDLRTPSWAILDWERMARDGWDAFFLTGRGQWETRHPDDNSLSLYGWDAASVLWLRPAYQVVA